MRILIVEDERALCDAIARSLRNLAYSVDCCHDGQEALDLLGVEVFDLVVLCPHVAKYSIKSPDSMPAPTITSPSRFIWTSSRREFAASRSGASHKTT